MSSSCPVPSIANTEIAIRVSNVGKRYRMFAKPSDRLKQMIWPKKQFFNEVNVLEGVTFDIYQGETVGIIGRNGAGKSTLLQIIAGTLTPSQGSVQVQGRVAPLIELGAGFNPEFSGHDNIMIYGQLLGMTREELDRKYDDIVKFADIGEYFKRPVKTYSSGMYARLAFAVAIHVDPKILIVDEILAVGDAPFQQKCVNRFYEIKESGCTILIVAHDQYLVRSMCDKAVYLKAGRMIAYGSAGEITGLYLEDIQPPAEEATSAEIAPAEAVAPTDAALPDAVAAEPQAETSGEPVLAETTEAIAEEPTAAPAPPPAHLFEISDVTLCNATGEPVETVRSGELVRLTMHFRALTDLHDDPISFVFNLYRNDGLYVCGTTTLMEGMGAHRSGQSGRVTVTFPGLPLLAGRYIWRVAVNDHGGMLVHVDAKGVCPFRAVDDFRSVGLVHLDRYWDIEIDGAPAVPARAAAQGSLQMAPERVGKEGGA